MAPSPWPEPSIDQHDVDALLDIAETAIATALAGHRPALPPLESLPPSLHRRVGAFVTLNVHGQLNGCIGTINGAEPLGHSVARLALSAAFADPRLPSLQPADYAHLDITISLLSPMSPIAAGSRADLKAALRPGHDGLVIHAGERQPLVLPTVWEQLPDPDDFLDHLWWKAGMRPRTGPAGMCAFRFSTQHHERRTGGVARVA